MQKHKQPATSDLPAQDKARPGRQLRVDNLVGDVCVLQPGEQIAAGRASAFPIGSADPCMHRRFLQFFSLDDTWFVRNIGSQITATIRSVSGEVSDQRIPPTKTGTLLPGESVIFFDTRKMAYEISVEVSGAFRLPDAGQASLAEWTENRFEPTPEQHTLLCTLASYVRHAPDKPLHIAVPSTEEIAADLGWSPKKTQTKMQRIARTLESLGIPEFRHTKEKYAWRLPLAFWAAENWDVLK